MRLYKWIKQSKLCLANVKQSQQLFKLDGLLIDYSFTERRFHVSKATMAFDSKNFIAGITRAPALFK